MCKVYKRIFVFDLTNLDEMNIMTPVLSLTDVLNIQNRSNLTK
jgi:hypothetical protein